MYRTVQSILFDAYALLAARGGRSAQYQTRGITGYAEQKSASGHSNATDSSSGTAITYCHCVDYNKFRLAASAKRKQLRHPRASYCGRRRDRVYRRGKRSPSWRGCVGSRSQLAAQLQSDCLRGQDLVPPVSMALANYCVVQMVNG